MSKTFSIELVRTGIGFTTLPVVAETQKEAETIALNKAGDLLYSETTAEYDVVNGTQNSSSNEGVEGGPEMTAQRATELLTRTYRETTAEDVTLGLYKAFHAFPPSNLVALLGAAIEEIQTLRGRVRVLEQGKHNAS